MAKSQKPTVTVPFQPQVSCPHCWHVFPPEDTLWISAHPELRGDPLLGKDFQQRFPPNRFTVAGHAIDPNGEVCEHLACPKCEMKVLRAVLEMESLYLSILGAPGSGKSYLLNSMTWRLRSKALLEHFRLSFTDADPESNEIVNRYHEKLFMNPQPDEPVSLPKTEREGDLYEDASIDGRLVRCAKSFIFSVQAEEGHPNYAQRAKLGRALCLYDNAGENFLPIAFAESGHVTRHMALASALLFLFDPTQHPKFRKACQGKSADPQMEQQKWMNQQHQVLDEAAKRIRNLTRLPQNKKDARPLIVVVTKYDAWNSLIPGTLPPGWFMKQIEGSSVWGLDVDKLRSLSNKIRGILMKYAEEIVAAAEGFSSDVIYIPVSALGCGPEVDPASGAFTIRPRDVDPLWAEIPMLYALHRSVPGLILPAGGESNAGRGVRPRPQSPSDAPTDQRLPRVFKETGT